MTTPQHVLAGTRTGIGNSTTALCTCGHRETAYDRAKAVAKLYAHTISAARPECPTPHKKRYGSEREAANAISRFLRMPGEGGRPTRTYRCPSGQHWHTTRQQASERAS